MDPLPLRIVMVEDHDMVASALGGVLDAEDDLEVVAIATTVDEALDAVRRHQPDLVITDLRLGTDDMGHHLGALRAAASRGRVLVVTGAPTDKALLDALEAGATGFIVKSQPMGEFVGAVRRVARGEVVVAPELSGVLLRRLDGRTRNGPDVLTRRELEVLDLLADGLGTADIADHLILSPNTIRNHVAAIMTKLDVHSRLEAVAEAGRRGIITSPRRS